MKKEGEITSIKLVDESTLSKLREVLPKRYHKSFEAEHKLLFKKQPVPSRQKVYEVLNGIRYNHEVMQVLKSMAEKRIEFTKELKSFISSAE